MQTTTLSTYDNLILEGKIQGKIEGEIEGKIKQALVNAEKLILVSPRWSDEKIADISGAPLEDVMAIRQRIAKSKVSKMKKAKPRATNKRRTKSAK